MSISVGTNAQVNQKTHDGLLSAHLMAAAPSNYTPALTEADASLIALELLENVDGKNGKIGVAFGAGFDCAVKLVTIALSDPIGHTKKHVSAAIRDAAMEIEPRREAALA